jgi:penicillin amidase
MRGIAAGFWGLLAVFTLSAETVTLPGLRKPVEILRDRWGVPHIYAQTEDDLFFAQGYITARDRLFQIDLWRRIGTGKLAEVLGPSAIDRDRLARAVRYRGPIEAEWQSYGPDTKRIAIAFTSGINAYIKSLNGKRPADFQVADYDPGLWEPEDCVARVAGLLMTHNLTKEVARVHDWKLFGLESLAKYFPPDPPVPLDVPKGLNPDDIDDSILRVYNQTIGPARFSEQGSNNWVVDGTLTTTGKPILANDPHRPVQMPSLRKAVHLVGPGWNAIGAGEPALPGIALGHNERIAFGFTIVGIDQQDLYVEKLDASNPDRYWYRGAWKEIETETQSLRVKGAKEPLKVHLRYTVHGPVIHRDLAKHRAYALRWVGTEPGAAGYLAGIALARAKNWHEFEKAAERFKVPSENVIYADTSGNIGWQVVGLTPIRNNWSGLFPVPGDSGEYEWSGFLPAKDLPHSYNPATHFIATANHNILPPGYKIPLNYEWALPFRFERITEMITARKRVDEKFSVADFERMQQDVVSVPARRFQAVVRKWLAEAKPANAEAAQKVAEWNAALTTDSAAAAIYEVWLKKLPEAIFGAALGSRTDLAILLTTLETDPHPKQLASALDAALEQLSKEQGPDMAQWRWGRLHHVDFPHPLNAAQFHRGPVERPGDGTTVNSTNGPGFQQISGASYREILDVSDWDRSVMTNVPGESGDPGSPHYSDLLDDWANGKYHPMPYTRAAVEAATVERITLSPQR